MLLKPKDSKKKKVTWKKAWDVFSLYIRTRDGFKCALGKDHNDVMQAGHVIDNGRGHAIRFLEDDVFCQCRSCNMAHSLDNWSYHKWYRQTYGEATLDEISILKKHTGKLYVQLKPEIIVFGKNDFASVKEYYESKLTALKQANLASN